MADDKPASSTVESVTAYVDRLTTLLEGLYTGRGSSVTGAEYMRIGSLRDALTQAKTPPGPDGNEYPRWLYREREQRTVKGHEEEVSATSEGWSRTAPERFEHGYPKFMCEKQQYDRRGVWLYSSADESSLQTAVEIADWMEDNEHQWGARGVPLLELISERKDAIKTLIDQEPLEPAAAAPDADELAQPADDAVALAATEEDK